MIVNDRAEWSAIFAQCFLNGHHSTAHYPELIAHLNNVKPTEGWFTEHYGGYDRGDGLSLGADGLKKPFQIKNTMKLDAIREEIAALTLNELDEAVALTALILALEKVDNTLGHYVSYLKQWSPRSYQDLWLSVPHFIKTQLNHAIYKEDATHLTRSIHADLAYYDPPYGSNNEKMPSSRVRYDAYYHFWKSVILNDQPKLFGVAKRRVDCSDLCSISKFEEFRYNNHGQSIAVAEIETLIKNTASRYILLSYSSGGRASRAQLFDVLSSAGKILHISQIHHKKNVMANMTWTDDWARNADATHREFLFLMEKHETMR